MFCVSNYCYLVFLLYFYLFFFVLLFFLSSFSSSSSSATAFEFTVLVIDIFSLLICLILGAAGSPSCYYSRCFGYYPTHLLVPQKSITCLSQSLVNDYNASLMKKLALLISMQDKNISLISVQQPVPRLPTNVFIEKCNS